MLKSTYFQGSQTRNHSKNVESSLNHHGITPESLLNHPFWEPEKAVRSGSPVQAVLGVQESRSGSPQRPGAGSRCTAFFLWERDAGDSDAARIPQVGGDSNPKRNLSLSDSEGLRFPLRIQFWVFWCVCVCVFVCVGGWVRVSV